MICKVCGQQLPDNANLCIYCGTTIEPEKVSAPQPTENVSATATPANNAGPSVAPTQSSAATNDQVYVYVGPKPQNNSGSTTRSSGSRSRNKEKSSGVPKALIAVVAVVLVALIIIVPIVFVTVKYGSISNFFAVMQSKDVYNEGGLVDVDNPDDSGDYEDEYVYVYFYPENGDYETSVEVLVDGYVTEPETPVRDGYVFEGWYDESLEEKWDFDFNSVNETLSLYAKWKPESSKYQENEKLIIAGDGLRLRATPDLSGQKITVIPNGTRIIVTETVDGWSYTTYNGKSGWCSSDFLYDPADYEGKALFKASVENTNGISMYVNQHTGSTVINDYIPYKSTVYVYEVEGDWSYVCYADQFGWCLSEYLDDF